MRPVCPLNTGRLMGGPFFSPQRHARGTVRRKNCGPRFDSFSVLQNFPNFHNADAYAVKGGEDLAPGSVLNVGSGVVRNNSRSVENAITGRRFRNAANDGKEAEQRTSAVVNLRIDCESKRDRCWTP